MPHYDLTGKVALVTGAARGIGLETATALAGKGARVVLLDLDAEQAAAAAALLGGPDRAIGIGADVTDRAALQRAVATAVERFGGLDVVVANAGIGARGATVRAMSTESAERVLDVNLMGVYRTVEAALGEVSARGGHVVVVASVYAFTNGLGAAPYAMAKAGVEQLGRALRVELAQHGASATVAYFGFIDTAMVHRAIDADPLAGTMMDQVPKALRKRLPPSVAGQAIVRGIERRSAQVIRPRRWTVLSVLRGILGPLSDRQLARSPDAQSAARALDQRGAEAQPTTA